MFYRLGGIAIALWFLSACTTSAVKEGARGNFASCAAAWQDFAERNHPDEGVWYFEAGKCSEAMGDIGKAEAYYTKAIRLGGAENDGVKASDRLAVLQAGGAPLSPQYVQAEYKRSLARSRIAQAEYEAEHADDESNAASVGMMSRPASIPGRRGAAQMPSFSNSARTTPTTVSSVNTIRYANNCATIGPVVPGSGGDRVYVDNSCGARVTVHTRGSLGIDSITVNPGRREWTTLERAIDYVCYVEPGQSLCEKGA